MSITPTYIKFKGAVYVKRSAYPLSSQLDEEAFFQSVTRYHPDMQRRGLTLQMKVKDEDAAMQYHHVRNEVEAALDEQGLEGRYREQATGDYDSRGVATTVFRLLGTGTKVKVVVQQAPIVDELAGYTGINLSPAFIRVELRPF